MLISVLGSNSKDEGLCFYFLLSTQDYAFESLTSFTYIPNKAEIKSKRTFNPTSQEAEAALYEFKAAWSIKCAPGQPGLYSE